MKLILGSSSASRRAVLGAADYDFDVVAPDIDEKDAALRGAAHPRDLPLLIARAKMDALLARIREPAIVIAADQVVLCAGYLHEKPASAAEALRFLERYIVGHPAETVAALVVANTETGRRAEGVDVARVYFSRTLEEDAAEYAATDDVLTHAGGFAIEHPLIEPHLRDIQGAEDSVRGLPLDLLRRLMAEVG